MHVRLARGGSSPPLRDFFRPGAKADCCLILEGPQGIRKSTALRTLAGEFFTDELADLGSKDAAMQTRGVWIIELWSWTTSATRRWRGSRLS
jgi:predicted P-loop ATPase